MVVLKTFLEFSPLIWGRPPTSRHPFHQFYPSSSLDTRIRIEKTFSIHSFQICCDSSDSCCTGSLVPALHRFLFASFAAGSGQKEVVRVSGIKDRITKVHMNQLLLSDSCLFIFYVFLFPGKCLCPLLHCFSRLSAIGSRIMSDGEQKFATLARPCRGVFIFFCAAFLANKVESS